MPLPGPAHSRGVLRPEAWGFRATQGGVSPYGDELYILAFEALCVHESREDDLSSSTTKERLAGVNWALGLNAAGQ